MMRAESDMIKYLLVHYFVPSTANKLKRNEERALMLFNAISILPMITNIQLQKVKIV